MRIASKNKYFLLAQAPGVAARKGIAIMLGFLFLCELPNRKQNGRNASTTSTAAFILL
jgi:hypothetical protein